MYCPKTLKRHFIGQSMDLATVCVSMVKEGIFPFIIMHCGKPRTSYYGTENRHGDGGEEEEIVIYQFFFCIWKFIVLQSTHPGYSGTK